jgi:diaminopimelate epimerase
MNPNKFEKYALKFTKYSATGNDFILIDNREPGLTEKDADLFKNICERRTSVGADGVLLINKHSQYDFELRYFNADGSEAECGNGARSAACFATTNKISASPLRFIFGKNTYEAEVRQNLVKIKMPEPRDLLESAGIVEKNFAEEAGAINTGVPHYVLIFPEIAGLDVINLGKKYRYHPRFTPEGTNVNFVEIISGNEIKVRTYERGVENETLSCGTGCVASAILSHLRKKLVFPITVNTSGGQLIVYYENNHYFLEGIVKQVYEGRLNTI